MHHVHTDKVMVRSQAHPPGGPSPSEEDFILFKPSLVHRGFCDAICSLHEYFCPQPE